MTIKTTLMFSFLLFLTTGLFAQPKMKIMRGNGNGVVREMTEDNMLHVPELSAMIIEDGKELTVDHIMEKEMRMKGYEDTELMEGDKIRH